MDKIIETKRLAKDVVLMTVESPSTAMNAQAGNFIMIMPDEKGERIPLTIYDWDRVKGTVTVVFKEIGTSTFKLGRLKAGDPVHAFTGPLGRDFPIKQYGTVILIGGGVGVPAIFPIARALRATGNRVVSIMGYRDLDNVILEDEMRSVSDETVIGTNDGSHGRKGFVTDFMAEQIAGKETFGHVVAVGPVVMMRAVTELAKRHGLPITVSLNALMLDATGMCGICRVTVAGNVKFSCIEGPDFDGTQVDFDELMVRLNTYRAEEKLSLEHYRQMAGEGTR